VVASASTDAEDCALLLAVLGIHPADGLSIAAERPADDRDSNVDPLTW
jgi:hypothetical protein